MRNLSQRIQLTCLFAVIFSLNGCSLFSPVSAKPPTAYELENIPHVAKKKKHPVSILVLLPDEVSTYNTTSMAYSLRPYEVAYYTQSNWAETPAQMLLPLLVQTLQNTNHFQAVVTPPFGGHYDYLLTTQIIKLEQDFTHQPARVVFDVRVQLNRVALNRAVATKEFHIRQRMFRNDAYSGVVAANIATESLLRKIADFATENTR